MARIVISSLLRRAIQSHSHSQQICLLLTLTHPSFGVRRFASDSQDITSQGFVYMAAPALDIGLISDKNDDAVVGTTISLPNADNRLLSELYGLYQGPIQTRRYMLATIVLVLYATPDRLEVELPELQVRSINKTDATITGQLDTEAVDSAPWPSGAIIPSDFPYSFPGG